MGRATLLYNNLGIGATWTASSEVVTLPATNLGTTIRQKAWRATGCTSEWCKANLGSAKAVQGIALVSGNLSASARVTIEANSSDSWAAPAFSHTFTPWLATRSGVVPVIFGQAYTYQWWRYTFVDASNSDGYIQLGVPVLSPTLELDSPPQGFRYQIVDPSPIGYSPGQTPYSWDLNPYAVVELPHGALSESLLFGDLQSLLRTMGRQKDGVLVMYPGGPGDDNISKATNLYGRITDLPPYDEVSPQRYGWSLMFRESL